MIVLRMSLVLVIATLIGGCASSEPQERTRQLLTFMVDRSRSMDQTAVRVRLTGVTQAELRDVAALDADEQRVWRVDLPARPASPRRLAPGDPVQQAWQRRGLWLVLLTVESPVMAPLRRTILLDAAAWREGRSDRLAATKEVTILIDDEGVRLLPPATPGRVVSEEMP
jgi:hypothetical protein